MCTHNAGYSDTTTPGGGVSAMFEVYLTDQSVVRGRQGGDAHKALYQYSWLALRGHTSFISPVHSSRLIERRHKNSSGHGGGAQEALAAILSKHQAT